MMVTEKRRVKSNPKISYTVSYRPHKTKRKEKKCIFSDCDNECSLTSYRVACNGLSDKQRCPFWRGMK